MPLISHPFVSFIAGVIADLSYQRIFAELRHRNRQEIMSLQFTDC